MHFMQRTPEALEHETFSYTQLLALRRVKEMIFLVSGSVRRVILKLLQICFTS